LRPVIVKDLKEVFRNRYLLFTLVILPIVSGLFGALIMAGVVSVDVNVNAPGASEAAGGVVIDAPVVPASPEIAELFKGVALVYESIESALEEHGYAVYVERVDEGFRVRVVVDFGRLIVEVGPLRALSQPLAGSSAVESYLEVLLFREPGETVRVVRDIDIVGVEGVRLAGALMLAGLLAFISFLLAGSLFSASHVSVGSDREQRVLELLASTPLTMSRYVAAKIVSTVIIGFIGAVSSAIGMTIYIIVVMRLFAGGSPGAGLLAGLLRESLEAALTWDVAAAMLASIMLTLVLGVGLSMLLAILLASDVRGAGFTSSLVYMVMFMLAVVALLSPLKLPYTLIYAVNPLTAGPSLVVLVASGRIAEAATVALLSLLLAASTLYLALRIADPERMVQHRPLITILRPRRFSAGEGS